jgi:hypothetical protein
MKAAVRPPLRLEQTTGVGWDAVGPADTTGLTLADNGRTFANSSQRPNRVSIACSGQLSLHVQLLRRSAKRSMSLSFNQRISGTVNSARRLRLKFTFPAGPTDFWCSAAYSYKIPVPTSTFSNFMNPAQPSIDIVDRLTKPVGTDITIAEAEDLGQIAVIYTL